MASNRHFKNWREFNLILWPQIVISKFGESLTLFYGLKSSFQNLRRVQPYLMASNRHFKFWREFNLILWPQTVISKFGESLTLYLGGWNG